MCKRSPPNVTQPLTPIIAVAWLWSCGSGAGHWSALDSVKATKVGVDEPSRLEVH